MEKSLRIKVDLRGKVGRRWDMDVGTLHGLVMGFSVVNKKSLSGSNLIAVQTAKIIEGKVEVVRGGPMDFSVIQKLYQASF
ncbi:hypothetical protein Tco_0836173 [Tanacetum coccineum]